MATPPTPELDPARRARRSGAVGAAVLVGLVPVLNRWGDGCVLPVCVVALVWWAVARVRARSLAVKALEDPGRRLTLWWAAMSDGLIEVDHPAPGENALPPAAAVTGHRVSARPLRRFQVVSAALAALVWASAALRSADDPVLTWPLGGLAVWLAVVAWRHLFRLAFPAPPEGLCLEATATHLAISTFIPSRSVPPTATWVATPIRIAWSDVLSLRVAVNAPRNGIRSEIRLLIYAIKPGTHGTRRASMDLRRVDVDLGAVVGLVQQHAPRARIEVNGRES